MPTCCSLLALRFRIQLPKDRDIVHDLSQPLLYPEIFFWVQFQPAAGPNVTWRNLSQARCGVLTRTIRPQSMPKYRQIALQFGLRWFMCMLHVYLCVCAVYCILMFIQRIPYVYAHIWTFIFDHIWSYLIIFDHTCTCGHVTTCKHSCSRQPLRIGNRCELPLSFRRVLRHWVRFIIWNCSANRVEVRVQPFSTLAMGHATCS